MFAKGSRYERVPEGLFVDPSGRPIPYKLLRLVPDQPPSLQGHVVVQGDRLDRLAATYYGDPEQFWRICDGNLAVRPDDLLVPGLRLLFPLGLR
jgi:hypothetical protein